MNLSLRNKKPIFLLFVLCIFVGITSIAFADDPTSPPPSGNTLPPVNVSSVSQSKTGGLGVGALSVAGGAQLGYTNVACDSNVEGTVIYANGTLQMCSNINALQAGTSSEYWTKSGQNIYTDFGGGASIGTNNLAPGTKLTVDGNIGASAYCDSIGGGCILASDLNTTPWSVGLGGRLFYTLGNVGIGVESAANPLAVHVNSTTDSIPLAVRNDDAGAHAVGIELANSAQRSLIESRRTGTDPGADLVISTTNALGSLAEVFRINEDGNAGLGDATPDNVKLDVQGKIGASEYCDQNGNYCIAANALGNTQWTDNGSDIYFAGGKVGVGVSAPAEGIHANLNLRTDGRHVYFGANQDLYGDNGGGLYFDSNLSTSSWFSLRDSDDDYFGSLFGYQGDYFGLLDGGGDWNYLHHRDDFTQFRIADDIIMHMASSGPVIIGGATTSSGTLLLDVDGQVGATEYCDENGANCSSAGSFGSLWNQNGTTLEYFGGPVRSNELNHVAHYVGTNIHGTSSGVPNSRALPTNITRGLYSWSNYGTATGQPTGSHGAAVGFGRGGSGSAEIWAGWTNGKLFTRFLRDCCQNWSDWSEIAVEGNTGTQFDFSGSIAMSSGSHLYLGSQDLYGDNNSALYFDSNNSSVSRLIMRDSDTITANGLGSLYGNDSGQFGLLDKDGNWFVQHTDGNNTNWRINNSEKMRLTDTGLGIYTTNPQQKLHIGGTGFSRIRVSSSDNQAGIDIDSSSTDGYWTMYGPLGSSDLGFYNYSTANGNNNRVTFKSDGDVGIGDSTPDGTLKLDVDGQVGATEYCDENGANCFTPSSITGGGGGGGVITGSGTNNTITKFNAAGNIVDSQIFDNGTNIGIGTVSPTYKLQTAGANSDASINGVRVGKGGGDVGTNTAVGDNALASNTTGYNNSAHGSHALGLNTTGILNAADGYYALYNNTTGAANTANGAYALLNNTTASYNTATGYQSLYENTTGANNTANGAFSLNKNTTGSDNTAIGRSSLLNNTTGYSNTAIGSSSLKDNTTGRFNTANGLNSLRKNTTGHTNTATGYNSLSNNTTGLSNTANGADALSSNTTGSNNVANGYQSLYSNTTGYSNTAIGQQSLLSNTTGLNNTAIGRSSLLNNTTGYSNTATGRSTLFSNTTGYDNAATGRDALFSNTTGSRNTATGNSSLYYNTTGSHNTSSGMQSLYYNTTGSYNSASGYQSLLYNTTGSYNSASGYRSLFSNTTGYYNTANGVGSLYSNTTGGSNTAVGGNALRLNTTGNNNTATGRDALYSNTTGGNNTANGFRSLYANTTGVANTANGYQSLRYNTTGNYNSASGFHALYANTTGSFNLANGADALRFNTTGSNNTANGIASLYANTTGNSNTANGRNALRFNTTGSNNTANGYYSLYSNTTGTYNTTFGYAAGDNITTGSSNIVIGSNINAPSATADNQLNIGNWIYGAGGNIGIGVAAPTQKLHVNGDIRLADASTGSIYKARGVYLGWSGGYGTQYNHGIFSADGTSFTDNITVNSYDDVRINLDSNNNDGDEEFVIGRHATGNTSNIFVVKGTGYTGIGGVPSPSEMLDVNGRVKATGFIQSSDARLKNNISTIENPERLLDLRGVTFDWMDSGRSDYGFIAQEIEDVYPELVATDENTGLKSVNYANINAILLELVKSQQTQIDELESRLDQVELNN